jgi:hypothetical protein
VLPVLAEAAAQHVKHRAQLSERRLARLVDRLQGGAGLLGPLVQQVQRHPRLHVDERDVVGQHVMQLPRDQQALLAGATSGLLPRRLGPLGTPLEAAARDLAGGADQRQPGEVRGLAGEAAGLLHLVGEHERQPGEGRVGERQHAPCERAPAHHDRAHHGEHKGGEPGRPAGVAAGGIAGGGGERDHQRGLWPAPAEQQRRRAGDQQDARERVERPRAGLVLAVDDRAGDLDDGDHQGQKHVHRLGPQPPGRHEPPLPPPGPARGPGVPRHPVAEARAHGGDGVGRGHPSTVRRWPPGRHRPRGAAPPTAPVVPLAAEGVPAQAVRSA